MVRECATRRSRGKTVPPLGGIFAPSEEHLLNIKTDCPLWGVTALTAFESLLVPRRWQAGAIPPTRRSPTGRTAAPRSRPRHVIYGSVRLGSVQVDLAPPFLVKPLPPLRSRWLCSALPGLRCSSGRRRRRAWGPMALTTCSGCWTPWSGSIERSSGGWRPRRSRITSLLRACFPQCGSRRGKAERRCGCWSWMSRRPPVLPRGLL